MVFRGERVLVETGPDEIELAAGSNGRVNSVAVVLTWIGGPMEMSLAYLGGLNDAAWQYLTQRASKITRLFILSRC